MAGFLGNEEDLFAMNDTLLATLFEKNDNSFSDQDATLDTDDGADFIVQEDSSLMELRAKVNLSKENLPSLQSS